jgi:hypothetical protein
MAGKLFLTGILIFVTALIAGAISSDTKNQRLEKLANFLLYVAFAVAFSGALVFIWL